MESDSYSALFVLSQLAIRHCQMTAHADHCCDSSFWELPSILWTVWCMWKKCSVMSRLRGFTIPPILTIFVCTVLATFHLGQVDIQKSFIPSVTTVLITPILLMWRNLNSIYALCLFIRSGAVCSLVFVHSLLCTLHYVYNNNYYVLIYAFLILYILHSCYHTSCVVFFLAVCLHSALSTQVLLLKLHVVSCTPG